MKTPAEKIREFVLAATAALRRRAFQRAADERIVPVERQGAATLHKRALAEGVVAGGFYGAFCWRPTPSRREEFRDLRDRLARSRVLSEIQQLRERIAQIPQDLVWEDHFANTVVTEGKNALLTHALKGSTYTASQVLGLLEDTGYSAIAAGNTAANITAIGGGSPTNGWNEAPVGTCALRQTPSFGTASSGSLAASATSHSILATDTIKGAFLLARSVAGTAPSTTVGNTNGALYSAGLFSGGDKAVANLDTLQVTYTASA